ncbi:MAG: hypothetical protein K9W44_00340 [Candidatus Lokiarchaeota archaeon]|nr:hypothetical protein [Candidatus Harpocratesius repetitus]
MPYTQTTAERHSGHKTGIIYRISSLPSSKLMYNGSNNGEYSFLGCPIIG